MPPFLKAKTAGLPRWVWVLALTGAVGVGLYLRAGSSRREGETETGESLEGYEGYEQATGLAAAGLIGPAQGTVTPVEAPYIPDGFVDIFGQLADLATLLGATIAEGTTAENIVKTETPVTGGGPPSEPIANIPPVPEPPKSCPTGTVQQMTKNKNEMNRMQGEINSLQGTIAQLTSWIQAHPKAKDKGKWQAERAQAQANIEGKRAKVVALNAANAGLRAVPGCAGVAI